MLLLLLLLLSIRKNLDAWLYAGKKGNASGGTAKESDQAGVKKEAGIPFILGLEAKEMGGLVSGNPQQLSKKKNINHSTKDKGIMVSVILGFTLFKLELRSKLQPII